jgi:hypothetical protein
MRVHNPDRALRTVALRMLCMKPIIIVCLIFALSCPGAGQPAGPLPVRPPEGQGGRPRRPPDEVEGQERPTRPHAHRDNHTREHTHEAVTWHA